MPKRTTQSRLPDIVGLMPVLHFAQYDTCATLILCSHRRVGPRPDFADKCRLIAIKHGSRFVVFNNPLCQDTDVCYQSSNKLLLKCYRDKTFFCCWIYIPERPSQNPSIKKTFTNLIHYTFLRWCNKSDNHICMHIAGLLSIICNYFLIMCFSIVPFTFRV